MAPPVDGAANEELIRFLKAKLKRLTKKVELVRGLQSRQKDFEIDAPEEQVLALLLG